MIVKQHTFPLHARLTRAERELLEQYCEERGYTISEAIRTMIRRATKETELREEIEKLRQEVLDLKIEVETMNDTLKNLCVYLREFAGR